jgi:TIR domain
MPARVFISYAHADESYRDQLDKQLAMLKRAGIIEIWHDRRLIAGQEWDHNIKSELEMADIILLLVSSDFLASDYVHDVEIQRAMTRHQEGAACVIPVILRHCIWYLAPFAKLQALPKDGKPIAKWANTDEAFLDVANGIHIVAKRFHTVGQGDWVNLLVTR